MTYPVTVGQLSVWRDIEKMAPEKLWEANLSFVWDLPPGQVELDAVWAALGALAVRHGSLRTTYLVGIDGRPRQRLTAETADDVLAGVRQGTADVAEREAFEAARVREGIDVTTELPWRAWVLTASGIPAQVLLVINHMAVDGIASEVLRADFLTILGGTALPSAPGPRELALDQIGAGRARLRNAERYWRRTLAAAPRRTPGTGDPVPVGATLHTGIPLPLAYEGAAKLEVTLSSLLLAAYYRAVRDVTGADAVLLYPMASNRYEADLAEVVTSLNQWTPLLLDLDPAEPFEAILPKVHWKAFNALKNGVYDPDVIPLVRAEHADADPGYYYNPVLARPGFPSRDELCAPRVEWYTPDRSTGPGFYLIARALTSIVLVLRVRRDGFDQAAVAACLASIQSSLADTLGGKRL